MCNYGYYREGHICPTVNITHKWLLTPATLFTGPYSTASIPKRMKPKSTPSVPRYCLPKDESQKYFSRSRSAVLCCFKISCESFLSVGEPSLSLLTLRPIVYKEQFTTSFLELLFSQILELCQRVYYAFDRKRDLLTWLSRLQADCIDAADFNFRPPIVFFSRGFIACDAPNGTWRVGLYNL